MKSREDLIEDLDLLASSTTFQSDVNYVREVAERALAHVVELRAELLLSTHRQRGVELFEEWGGIWGERGPAGIRTASVVAAFRLPRGAQR